ncbi:hypothetical protein AAHC03_01543 [Spirometra sp. Aus1]
MTPLHLAVENQDVVMVNFLLSEGAEVDCITNAKKSALMISCEKGDAEIADLLINCGANCELRDCDEHTAEEIAKLNDHEECYQLLHSLRDSVGSVGHASSSQRPARSSLPSELRSSYREREVTPLPGLTTSAKSTKSEFKVVDRKPWRLSDVLGEDTGDDVVDIETDLNSPATAENSDGDSSVAEPVSRGNSGDQDLRTAVCSVENANESECQTQSSERDVDEGQGDSKTEEGVRPRLFRRKSTTENRVASPSTLVVGGATVPPNAARRFVSSPSQSDPKNTNQSWESEPGGTKNRTMKSPEVHLTPVPVSVKKPEIDEEEDSWASEDTDNNEPTKPGETLVKAFAQKIPSSSGEDKPSREKGLEHGTDSESDTEDWNSNNSEEGRQPALMDTASAFARVRQQMRFSLGLDQSEDEEEDREVKDVLVNPSPKVASKAAMERSDLNQSPWDSSASEMPPAKEDVQAPRSPVVGGIWLKSSSKSQQDEQIRITPPERKPGSATPEVDDRWDSSSSSDVDEIPMLGDEVTPVKENGNTRATAKAPSPTETKNDSVCVTGADKPVTKLMQAVDYEDGLDEEEDGPDGGRSDSNEARAVSAQLSGSRTLPTALYRPRDYDSDEAGLGLSPIEEKTEDCFSFASTSSHSKKEENAHQSVCLSPGTSLTAEPIYVNAEWLKQVSEADSTGTGIANLPSESRSLKITQTVATDTDVKQNQTARFETHSTESAPVVRRSPLSPSSEHTLTQQNGKCSSRPSGVEMLRQMLHAKLPANTSQIGAHLTSDSNQSGNHDPTQNPLTQKEPDAGGNSPGVCFEERLVEALRALEREHRERQKVEAELDKARAQLAEAVMIAEAPTSEDSTSVPRDVSEIAAECNLLRMKLNEETDHRQSLEAVYENLKKQLIEKEEELFKSRSQCQDLEMEVKEANIRLKSARAEYERLKRQLEAKIPPPNEAEGSEFAPRDFMNRTSVFSVEAPSVSRHHYVPDGGPVPTNVVAVQATNNTSAALPEVKLHITLLRELISTEKLHLKGQTDEMHGQLQQLHSLFKELADKVVRSKAADSSADRTKLLEIEIEHLHETQMHLEHVANEKLRKYAQQIEDQAIRLGSLSHIDVECEKLQSANKTAREDLEFYKDKCTSLEVKLAESEKIIESEQRQLEKLESDLREALQAQSKREEDISRLKEHEEALFLWLAYMCNDLSAIESATAAVHTSLSQLLKPMAAQDLADASRTFTSVELLQVEELLRILLSAREAANKRLDEMKSAGLLKCAADTEEGFLAKKKALLQAAKLPPPETDSALLVEQFLIERLLLRTRAEHEAVCLANERQTELLRVKAEVAQLTKMKGIRPQNESSQSNADAFVVLPLTASGGDEVGVFATANEHSLQRSSVCMGSQAPIGSFENVFARLKNPVTRRSANLEFDGCPIFAGKEADPLQCEQTENNAPAHKTLDACKTDPSANYSKLPQDSNVLVATFTKAINELQGQNAALQHQLKLVKASAAVDRRSAPLSIRSRYCPENNETEQDRLKKRVTELEQERGRILTEKQLLEENARTEHKLASKLLQHMDILSSRPVRRRGCGSTTMTPARRRPYRHTSVNSASGRHNSESPGSPSEHSSDDFIKTPVQKPAKHRSRGRSGGKAKSRRPDHQNTSFKPEDTFHYEPVNSARSEADSDQSSVGTPRVDHDIKRSRRPLVERRPYQLCSNPNPSIPLDRFPTRDITRNFGNVFFPHNVLSVAPTASTTNILLQRAKLSLQAVEKDLSSLGPPPDVNSNELLQSGTRSLKTLREYFFSLLNVCHEDERRTRHYVRRRGNFGHRELHLHQGEDTGKSMLKLNEYLRSLGATSVHVSCLLLKRTHLSRGYTPDFLGFEVPDRFIVGYAIDYNECFRDLLHICSINEKAKKVFAMNNRSELGSLPPIDG